MSDGEAASRAQSGLTGAASAVLAVVLTLLSLAWAADLHRRLGFVLYTEQFLAAVLALTLALTYLRVPARKAGQGASWFDAAAALLGFAAAGYVALWYPDLVTAISYRPPFLVALGVVLVALTLEGLRRLVGLPLTLVIVGFILYGLFGEHVPGMLRARPVAPERLAAYLALDPNAMLGTPLIVASVIIIPFIFLGQLLKHSGGSGFFTDVSLALMGRYRGGPAKVAITASALFGSISGSAVSNVATTGVMTIPMMRDAGYTPRMAGAIEALASTGGQLMPPVMGAAAFLMAEFLQISYGEVVIAAIVPSLLFYLALFIQAHLEAARRGIAPVARALIPPLGRVLARGWHFVLPFAALLIALFAYNWRPEAAVLAALVPLIATGMVIGYGDRRLTPGNLLAALRATGHSVLDIVLICAGAGLVIGVLNASGLGFGLTIALVNLGQGQPLVLLAAAAVASMVLGMGMPTVGVYVLLATLVAPALVELGIAPMAAHMFVLYFGMMSMITPPVALAAFAAASIAGSEPMRTGVTAVRLGWATYLVPFLFVAAPSLIMQGTTGQVVLATATALAGIWFTSVGVIGYCRRALGPAIRTVFGVAGIGLLIPADAFEFALWTDTGGAVLGLALTLWLFLAGGSERAADAEGAGKPVKPQLS